MKDIIGKSKIKSTNLPRKLTINMFMFMCASFRFGVI